MQKHIPWRSEIFESKLLGLKFGMSWAELSDDLIGHVTERVGVVARMRVSETCKRCLCIVRNAPCFLSANEHGLWYDVDTSLVEKCVPD